MRIKNLPFETDEGCVEDLKDFDDCYFKGVHNELQKHGCILDGKDSGQAEQSNKTSSSSCNAKLLLRAFDKTKCAYSCSAFKIHFGPPLKSEEREQNSDTETFLEIKMPDTVTEITSRRAITDTGEKRPKF